MTANVVVPESGANGVIVTQGGSVGGWSLYAHEGKLKYCYNFFGIEHYIISADEPIPAGKHQVRMEFTYDGGGLAKGGDVTLYYDGKAGRQGPRRADRSRWATPPTRPATSAPTPARPPHPDYGPTGNRFTGEIDWVQTRHRRGQPRPPHHARGPAYRRDGTAIVLLLLAIQR